MHWLFGVVIGAVVLVLLILTVVNFRRYSWLIVLVFVLFFGALGTFFLRDSGDGERRHVFDVNDIVLTNAELSPSHGSYYRFSVSVQNLSPDKPLAAIEVLIELLDCSDEGAERECTVSESSQQRINLRLLAADSKRIEAYIPFANIAVERADNQWRYKLIRGIGR